MIDLWEEAEVKFPAVSLQQHRWNWIQMLTRVSIDCYWCWLLRWTQLKWSINLGGSFVCKLSILIYYFLIPLFQHLNWNIKTDACNACVFIYYWIQVRLLKDTILTWRGFGHFSLETSNSKFPQGNTIQILWFLSGYIFCGFQCSYAACYCEENVYKICQTMADTNPEELIKCWVVFVSNKKRVVPLWRQKAGKDEEKLVIWDYHVVLLYRPDDRY